MRNIARNEDVNELLNSEGRLKFNWLRILEELSESEWRQMLKKGRIAPGYWNKHIDI